MITDRDLDLIPDCAWRGCNVRHAPGCPNRPPQVTRTVTRVVPGQTWRTRSRYPSAPLTVLTVDRALVTTSRGRTTVFALNRHWRLSENRSDST